MPWCPKCRTEYREGFIFCSDCGSELVDKLPAKRENEKEQIKKDEVVTLTKAYNPIEAELLKSRLEAEGIPVLTSGETVGRLYGVLANGLAEIQIKVPKSKLEQAQRILGEIQKMKEKTLSLTRQERQKWLTSTPPSGLGGVLFLSLIVSGLIIALYFLFRFMKWWGIVPLLFLGVLILLGRVRYTQDKTE